jgi:HAD superfamily hydrolase (TIGR01509 family)
MTVASLPHLERFDGIVFDCDGVLADSEPIYAQVVADLMTTAGVARSALDCRHRYTGLDAAAMIARVIEEDGIDLTEALVGRVAPVAHELMRTDLRACEGAADLVRAIDRPRAVASNSSLSSVVLSLELIGLHDAFPGTVTSAEEVHRGKPDPAVYRLAARRAGVDPAGCIAIDDSPTGARAALAAGMTVIGFIGSSHDPRGCAEGLRNAGVKFVVDDFRALAHHWFG